VPSGDAMSLEICQKGRDLPAEGPRIVRGED
jgi:hypothetical protein